MSEPAAFLCWQPYGRGKVVYLSAPATYRLRNRQGDQYHHRFWGQLLRWAIASEMRQGSRTVQLGTDRLRYGQDQAINVSAQVRDLRGVGVPGVTARVVAVQQDRVVAAADLRPDEQSPGTYRATFDSLPTGLVQISIEEQAGDTIAKLLEREGVAQPPNVVITIDPEASPELRQTRCNLPLLEKITQASNGMIVPPTALEALIDQLDLAPRISQSTKHQPMWTRWALLWVFFGCLCMEWVVRKMSGLS